MLEALSVFGRTPLGGEWARVALQSLYVAVMLASGLSGLRLWSYPQGRTTALGLLLASGGIGWMLASGAPLSAVPGCIGFVLGALLTHVGAFSLTNPHRQLRAMLLDQLLHRPESLTRVLASLSPEEAALLAELLERADLLRKGSEENA